MTHTASMRVERGAAHQTMDQPCGGDRHGGGHRGLQFCRGHGGHGHCRSKPDLLPSSRRLVHTEPQLWRLGMDGGELRGVHGKTRAPRILEPRPDRRHACPVVHRRDQLHQDRQQGSRPALWLFPMDGVLSDSRFGLRHLQLARRSGTDTPNGPFTVMEGKYNGHPVKPSGTGAVESQGGPMFLYVGYWGRVGMVNGHTNGYVFGLRGHLDIPSCTRNPCPAVGL